MAEIERTKEAENLFDEAFLLSTNADKDYATALTKFGEVLKLLPNDDDSFTWKRDNKTCTKAEVYYYQGKCCVGLEEFEKALEYYDKAISLNPNNDGYYYQQGHAIATYVLGETEKAADEIEKAAKLSPTDAAKIYFNFGQNIQSYTGNKKETAKYYQKSVEHGDCFGGMAKKRLAEWGM